MRDPPEFVHCVVSWVISYLFVFGHHALKQLHSCKCLPTLLRLLYFPTSSFELNDASWIHPSEVLCVSLMIDITLIARSATAYVDLEIPGEAILLR
jgi:hypothetical protein